MTVVARTFCAIPQRSALETWGAIVELLAPNRSSDARRELEAISGVAASLIASEAMTSAVVVAGSGPRVRIYCSYGDDAVSGDGSNESPLAFCATEGNWSLSLPAPVDDVEWIAALLSAKSPRISVREMGDVAGAGMEAWAEPSGTVPGVIGAPNVGAFLRR
jgi:hypothetical protein